MKNNWTHERISRKAEAYQWDGSNTDQVFGLLAQHGMVGELFRDNQYIQVYYEQSYDSTLRKSDWLLIGEDSILRFYPDEKFRLMYRPIDDELERLRAFAREVIAECIDGHCQSIDEIFILDIAGSHRLVATHFPIEPCGEICACREKYGNVDFDLVGVECVRLADSVEAVA